MPVKNNSRFTAEQLNISPYSTKAKQEALKFLRSTNKRRRSRLR